MSADSTELPQKVVWDPSKQHRRGFMTEIASDYNVCALCLMFRTHLYKRAYWLEIQLKA